MDIVLSYSQAELDAAVDFISENNDNFYGQQVYIRQSIMESMDRLAKDFNLTYVGTMGFMIIADREVEDMDNDHYTCHIEIMVDPALGKRDWNNNDYQTKIITVDGKGVSIWDE